jgi:hypothetical protein
MGPIASLLQYTSGQEPAISASLLAAVILYGVTRLVPGLTTDDLTVLGIIALVVSGFIIRLGVFAPLTAQKQTADAYDEGKADGVAMARSKPGMTVTPSRNGVKGS